MNITARKISKEMQRLSENERHSGDKRPKHVFQLIHRTGFKKQL